MMEWAYFDGTRERRCGARGKASVIGTAGRFVGKDLRGPGPPPRLFGGRLCAGVTGEMERELTAAF